MKVSELSKFRFKNWYKDFKFLTIKSIIIPLPNEFISYLLQDGIVLPKSKYSANIVCQNSNDSEDEDQDDWEDDSEEPVAPHFPTLEAEICEGIKRLEGKVFPKLDWSSPRDAAWIGFNNTCCCTSSSDVYLLLKSSDFIAHDLTQRLPNCEDYVEYTSSHQEAQEFYLTLRKWMEIDTSGEFRCFVKNNSLIGITQREPSLYFEHIRHYEKEIVEDILLFFKKHIHHKFHSENYIFDVYIRKKDHIYIIDFNPFDKVTDSLLFSWNELNDDSLKVDENNFPEFRYVQENHGVQPRALSLHAMPRDVVDLSTGTDSFKLVDLLRLKISTQNEISSDSEDESWTI